jgi:hypothetical protein
MNPTFLSLFFALGLGGGMVALMVIGRRLGLKRRARDSDGARAGLAAVEGAIFALLGLMIAFTFSGASSHFDVRRQLITDEANSIGTAWQRIDLLPEAVRKAVSSLRSQPHSKSLNSPAFSFETSLTTGTARPEPSPKLITAASIAALSGCLR